VKFIYLLALAAFCMTLQSLFVDHDRLLLGMEDGLCVVELNKDSKLWCNFVITQTCKLFSSEC